VENPFFGSIPKGVEGGRPQEALLCAKAKRQRQKSLSVRKRSVSGKCFICAKAKRQKQMFYLRESEAAAIKAPSRNGTQLHVLIMSFF